MINIEMLFETFGDEEFVSELFGQYLLDNKDVNIRIQKQIEDKQFDSLFRTFHTLYGALSSICEVDIVPAIKCLEETSRKGEMPAIEDINYIKLELNNIKLQMENYLA